MSSFIVAVPHTFITTDVEENDIYAEFLEILSITEPSLELGVICECSLPNRQDVRFSLELWKVGEMDQIPDQPQLDARIAEVMQHRLS